MQRVMLWLSVVLVVVLAVASSALAAPLPVTYSSDLLTSACMTGSSGTAGNAADNNTGTFWQSSTTFPNWVRCDFGGTPRTIRRITIRAHSSSGFFPTDFRVEYSDDLSTWSVAATIGPESGWSVNETRTYSFGSVGVVSRYWRVIFTASTGTTVVVTELEMMYVISEDDPTATPTTGPTNTPTPFPDITSSVSDYNTVMDTYLPGYVGLLFLIALVVMFFVGMSQKGR